MLIFFVLSALVGTNAQGMCPEGYRFIPQELHGEGELWAQPLATRTTDDCAAICNQRSGCTAFTLAKEESNQGACATFTGAEANIENNVENTKWLSCMLKSIWSNPKPLCVATTTDPGSCKTTPSAYIGPFYVKREYTLETQCIAFSKTNPNPGKCDDEEYTKEPIRIQGKIMDTQCNPVDGAIIEYWQAAPKWSDSHPKLYTMVTMDCKGDCIADMGYKGYRGWQTATKGDYHLNTVRPGIYNDLPIRHMHFKITVPGKNIDGKDSLITQMYLPQDEPTIGDEIYNKYIDLCQRYTNKPELWAKKQKLDTCPIRADPDGPYYYGKDLTIYNWDIVLNISH